MKGPSENVALIKGEGEGDQCKNSPLITFIS